MIDAMPRERIYGRVLSQVPSVRPQNFEYPNANNESFSTAQFISARPFDTSLGERDSLSPSQVDFKGHHDTIWLQGLQTVSDRLARPRRRLRCQQLAYSGRRVAIRYRFHDLSSWAANTSRCKITLFRRLGGRRPDTHSVLSGHGLEASTLTNVGLAIVAPQLNVTIRRSPSEVIVSHRTPPSQPTSHREEVG